MRPLVGISPERDASPEREFKAGWVLELLIDEYAHMIAQAGMQPIVLSSAAGVTEELLAPLDAVVLSGGSDLDPSYWNEKPLPPDQGGINLIDTDNVERTAFEHHLVLGCLRRGIPMLGICRGLQQLNVSLGGSLVQDLEVQRGISGHYERLNPCRLVHNVSAVVGSPWPSELETTFAVTSTHHQAVDRPARGLRVLACDTQDGLIELQERDSDYGPLCEGDRGALVLATQWHPERMVGSPSTQWLLARLYKAAAERAEARRTGE